MKTPSAQDELSAYLSKTKKLVDKRLLKILLSIQPEKLKPKHYRESVDHSVLMGGKRLRPILAIAVHELFSSSNKDVITPACAVELIHAGSLMLDDLPCMDNAQYRRGQKTTHTVFGESTTILASAALWVAAFGILGDVQNDSDNILVREAASCMGGKGLIQGQLLDLAAFNNAQNIKQLEECYRLKTGVLFSLAATIGAVTAGASNRERALVENFAESIGIAYQIRDDILDTTQSKQESGKDEKLDLRNNKPNYVSILGVDATKKALQTKVFHALNQLDKLERNSATLRLFAEQLLDI